ncbi:MAG: alpha/beta hydrolase fold [Cyanobacteria bacterium RYN_339]|nr:alpha/beta hydrolase fold [Cyanobacteria bacterium RYN_339]
MIDPYRAIVAMLAGLAAVQPDPRAGFSAEPLELEAAGGALPARFFRPFHWDGPLVVYVHGAATADWLAQAPLFEALLARGLAVLAFDLDGYGSNPAVLDPKGILRCVPAALEAARNLPGVNAARIGVYGLSLGAALTLRALPGASWVKAMTLYAPPLGVSPTTRDRLLELAGTFHPFALPVLATAPTGHVARTFLEPVRFAGARHDMFHPEFIVRMDALVRGLDPLAAARAAPALPTLIINGAWDALVTPMDVERLRLHLNGAIEVATFAHRNHSTLLHERGAARAAANWFHSKL